MGTHPIFESDFDCLTEKFAIPVGILAVSIFVFRKYFNSANAKNCERAISEKVGTVSALFIYPLKSCKAKEISRGKATAVGLSTDDGLCDRWFSVRYESNNMKVTAREEPSLLQITVEVDSGNKFRFNAPNCHDLIIDAERTDKKVTTIVFGDKADGFDAGDEAAKWITKYLQKACRISFNPSRILRQDSKHWERNWRLNDVQMDSDQSSFADKYPYLLLGEKSVDDINSKIPNKNYSAVNFRANIIVDTTNGTPWEEDGWVGEVRIGEAVFGMASPCARCVFTTIDPTTGERDLDGEPLKTLKTFRLASGRDLSDHSHQYRKDPLVGMCLVLIQPGAIAVGDEVLLNRKM